MFGLEQNGAGAHRVQAVAVAAPERTAARESGRPLVGSVRDIEPLGLSGQRLPVLNKRRVSGIDRLIRHGTFGGTFCVPASGRSEMTHPHGRISRSAHVS